jgi:hypothetical protein
MFESTSLALKLGLLLNIILGVNQCWTVLIFFKELSGLVLTRTLENWPSF